MTTEELTTKRRELKHELLNLRVQQQSGQLENPARLRLIRKDVARVESILSQRVHGVAAKGAGKAAA